MLFKKRDQIVIHYNVKNICQYQIWIAFQKTVLSSIFIQYFTLEQSFMYQISKNSYSFKLIHISHRHILTVVGSSLICQYNMQVMHFQKLVRANLQVIVPLIK